MPMRFSVMALHYFHVRAGPRVALDPQGIDCVDLAAAKRHAATLAAGQAEHDDDWRIEIADASGRYLASVDRHGVVAD